MVRDLPRIEIHDALECALGAQPVQRPADHGGERIGREQDGRIAVLHEERDRAAVRLGRIVTAELSRRCQDGALLQGLERLFPVPRLESGQADRLVPCFAQPIQLSNVRTEQGELQAAGELDGGKRLPVVVVDHDRPAGEGRIPGQLQVGDQHAEDLPWTPPSWTTPSTRFRSTASSR